jgi:hypothetical protein
MKEKGVAIIVMMLGIWGCAHQFQECKSISGPRPKWIDHPVETCKEDSICVVGTSRNFAQEADAQTDSDDQGRIAALMSVEVAAKRTFEEMRARLGLSTSAFNPSTAAKEFITIYGGGIMAGCESYEYYRLQCASPQGENYWRIYARTMCPRNQVKKDFNEFVRQKREEWGLTTQQIEEVMKIFEKYTKEKGE